MYKSGSRGYLTLSPHNTLHVGAVFGAICAYKAWDSEPLKTKD